MIITVQDYLEAIRIHDKIETLATTWARRDSEPSSYHIDWRIVLHEDKVTCIPFFCFGESTESVYGIPEKEYLVEALLNEINNGN